MRISDGISDVCSSDLTVSQALIDVGEEDVIEALIRNEDAELALQAVNYLVEESRRVDRFREPLLQRREMSPALAYRMFWWVSAALRRQIDRKSTRLNSSH